MRVHFHEHLQPRPQTISLRFAPDQVRQKGYKIVITKNQTQENCDAVELLVKTLFVGVIRTSRGTFMCKVKAKEETGQ